MENVWIRNKKSKLSLKSKILLVGLALVVIAGLGAATQAALENTDNENMPLFGRMSFFDPFALRRITLAAGRSYAMRTLSGGTSRAAIQTPLPQPSNFNWVRIWVPIPRPPLRSRPMPRPGT